VSGSLTIGNDVLRITRVGGVMQHGGEI
jgi:hypothetical protein